MILTSGSIVADIPILWLFGFIARSISYSHYKGTTANVTHGIDGQKIISYLNFIGLIFL